MKKVGDIVRRHSTGTLHRITEIRPSGRIKIDGWKRRYNPDHFTVLTDSEAVAAVLLGQIGHNTPWQGFLRQRAGVRFN